MLIFNKMNLLNGKPSYKSVCILILMKIFGVPWTVVVEQKYARGEAEAEAV